MAISSKSSLLSASFPSSSPSSSSSIGKYRCLPRNRSISLHKLTVTRSNHAFSCSASEKAGAFCIYFSITSCITSSTSCVFPSIIIPVRYSRFPYVCRTASIFCSIPLLSETDARFICFILITVPFSLSLRTLGQDAISVDTNSRLKNL